ncbi:MAG: hypothetical protein U0939_04015 [Pirellulales bacterium]
MPDPWIYAWSLTAAAAVSAWGFWIARRLGAERARVASYVEEAAVVTAVLIGAAVIGLQARWPPSNGLSRLFLIVLPAVALSAQRFTSGRGRAVWWALCLAAPWILWWKSVYSPATAWDATASFVSSCTAYIASVLMLAGTVESAAGLAARIDRRAVSAVLSASLVAAGMLIAMAGYLQGGAAAVPLAGALVGSCLVARPVAADSSRTRIATWGAAGLWGVLFVGRFFGAITTADAAATAAVPSLGWAAVWLMRRGCSPRVAVILYGVVAALLLGGWLAWGVVLFRERLGRLA